MSPESESKNKNHYVGFVIFCGIIATFFGAALIYQPSRDTFFDVVKKNVDAFQSIGTKQTAGAELDAIRALDDRDHIRGNRNAPVVFIEYADTECPFSKAFQPIMKKIVDEYAATGSVAWVYRHFPNDQIHPKARTESIALECAGQLGGNDVFWKYTDRIFDVTPSNNNLDFGELTRVALELGLDRQTFERCVADGKHAARIQRDSDEAVNSGAQGTPNTIVFSSSGTRSVISGAESYESLHAVIERALQE